jgi:hypothetical protein
MSRFSGRLPALLVAASVVLGAGLATPAAHAESWHHRDARGDVVNQSTRDGSPIDTAAPRDRTADITDLTIRHGSVSIRVDLQLRDLRAATIEHLVLRLRTPRATYMAVVTTGGDEPTVSTLLRGVRFRTCDMTVSLKPRLDAVTVALPPSCVDHPRWVRLAAYLTVYPAPSSRSGPVRRDDALINGGDGRSITWSARVRRG